MTHPSPGCGEDPMEFKSTFPLVGKDMDALRDVIIRYVYEKRELKRYREITKRYVDAYLTYSQEMLGNCPPEMILETCFIELNMYTSNGSHEMRIPLPKGTMAVPGFGKYRRGGGLAVELGDMKTLLKHVDPQADASGITAEYRELFSIHDSLPGFVLEKLGSAGNARYRPRIWFHFDRTEKTYVLYGLDNSRFDSYAAGKIQEAINEMCQKKLDLLNSLLERLSEDMKKEEERQVEEVCEQTEEVPENPEDAYDDDDDDEEIPEPAEPVAENETAVTEEEPVLFTEEKQEENKEPEVPQQESVQTSSVKKVHRKKAKEDLGQLFLDFGEAV